MYGFIYITTNHINGKRYIGQKKYDKRDMDKYIYSRESLTFHKNMSSRWRS